MRKILLVEDNEANRDMLSRRLAKRGYQVVMAVDGLEAIKQAVEEGPDLILMDLSLPNVDGFEASQRIRAMASTAHIPVIALSAHVLSFNHQMALDAGCNDYETKPIDLKRLILKMETLLSYGNIEVVSQ
ncbi:MAG: response regulator [Sedimenticola sp.]